MKILILITAVLFSAIAAAQSTTTFVIHFDFDRYDIRRRDAISLDTLLSGKMFKSIELHGHCDSVGDHAYNDALSRKRVAQTKAYLLQMGNIAEEDIIIAEGFGKRRPLNDNRSEKERFDNRRVEIVINWGNSGVSTNEVSKPTLMEQLKSRQPSPNIVSNNTPLSEVIKDTSRIKAGSTFILRNIQFIPGRHYLLPESQPTLDTLLQIMKEHSTLVIEIQGHVCCTPDNEDGYDLDLRTMNLSVQRARTIFDYLMENGIDPARLSFIGYGGSRKLYPQERDDFERQENRRVELKIIRR